MDDEHERHEAQGNAGAFLAPYSGVVPVPMSTTGDIGDAPPEPDDPAQPAPPPLRRSWVDKLLGRHPLPPKDL